VAAELRRASAALRALGGVAMLQDGSLVVGGDGGLPPRAPEAPAAAADAGKADEEEPAPISAAMAAAAVRPRRAAPTVLSAAAAAAAAAAPPSGNAADDAVRRVQGAVAALMPPAGAAAAGADGLRVLMLRGGTVVPATAMPIVTGAAFSDALTVVADSLLYGGPQIYRPPTAKLVAEVMDLVRAARKEDVDARAAEDDRADE